MLLINVSERMLVVMVVVVQVVDLFISIQLFSRHFISSSVVFHLIHSG